MSEIHDELIKKVVRIRDLESQLDQEKKNTALRVKAWTEEVECLEGRLEKERGRLDWIESNTTLHNSIETGYYVDHYEVVVVNDLGRLELLNRGSSIRDAIDVAMEGNE